MYVSWLTARDTFHLAGYRIGGGGVHGTLFSRTMPGEMVSLAGGQVLVWDPGVSLYLADPVPGRPRESGPHGRTPGESSGKTATARTLTRRDMTDICEGDDRARSQTRTSWQSRNGARLIVQRWATL